MTVANAKAHLFASALELLPNCPSLDMLEIKLIMNKCCYLEQVRTYGLEF